MSTGTQTHTKHKIFSCIENACYNHAQMRTCPRRAACANIRCVRSQLYLVRHTRWRIHARPSHSRYASPPFSNLKPKRRQIKLSYRIPFTPSLSALRVRARAFISATTVDRDAALGACARARARLRYVLQHSRVRTRASHTSNNIIAI